MAPSYAVVDGSNIATEGRSVPSLAQLDDAVRQFQAEFPGTEVIVVVDATFGHRIDPSERQAFDEAVSHAELVSPPAGAVGRGDAFLLRVAERVGAQVLSNDSFQEFHAEHPWLFDEGRLIGGKPVPGVGWIFTPRSPVRGVRSRSALSVSAAKTAKSAKAAKSATIKDAKAPGDGRAVSVVAAAVAAAGADITAAGAPPARTAKKTKKAAKAEATQKKEPAKKTEAQKTAKAAKKTKKAPEAPSKSAKVKKAGAPENAAKSTTPGKGQGTDAPVGAPVPRTRRGRGRRATAPDVRAAIDVATVEAIAPHVDSDGEARESKARRRAEPPAAVNDPLTFLTFVSEHPIGSTVEGTVSSFVSHGAMVDVGGMQCYVPLAGLAAPAPRRAREVLDRGQLRQFVLVALDPARRGAELALPEVAAQRLAR
jgi:Zc3h12a-like Ribonuclease NYN domain/S1 RNA binding domain